MTILLTTESLLLAAIGLAVTLTIPGGARQRALLVKPTTIAIIAICGIGAVAVGAFIAWTKIFLTPPIHGVANWVIASILLVPIVIEPVLAAFISFTTRLEH